MNHNQIWTWPAYSYDVSTHAISTLIHTYKQKWAETEFFFQEGLIDWLFTVLRPAQEYFTYMEMSPMPVKGCKI
jgi:hypothetical protein